ncbi:MAG: GntP family permease [Bacteroidota bacterium]
MIFLWLLIVVLLIVLLTGRWGIHPFITLILGSISMGFIGGLSPSMLVESIGSGFGSTLSSIGIVIAAGAMIGEYLDRSGGAVVVANRILSVVGEKYAALSMSLTGFIVSIPVFCDTGFIVLNSIKEAIAKRTGHSLTVLSIALATGLYTTHVFIPPTPGPIAAAATLEADLGWVLGLGLVVSIPVMFVGLLWAIKGCSRFETTVTESSEGEDRAEPVRPDITAPTFRLAISPILVPILLIALNTIASYPTNPLGEGTLFSLVTFLGEPIIALLIGVAIAFAMVREWGRDIHSHWMESALKKAGVIILITGAGGSFGAILRETELSDVVSQFALLSGLGVLVPYAIAAFLKTAQGSSTVAIITAAAITAPLMGSLGLDSVTGKALVVLAIGAGSLTISHINDSYFWVVAKFSNMDTTTALKTHSVATLLMGLTGLVTVQLLAWVLL